MTDFSKFDETELPSKWHFSLMCTTLISHMRTAEEPKNTEALQYQEPWGESRPLSHDECAPFDDVQKLSRIPYNLLFKKGKRICFEKILHEVGQGVLCALFYSKK